MMARWTRRVGIWTVVLAITSAASAIIFFRQQVIMQGQLDEARAQREMTTAQVRANVVLNTVQIFPANEHGVAGQPDQKIVNYAVSPIWQNIGGTTAQDFFDGFALVAAPRKTTTENPYAQGNCPKMRRLRIGKGSGNIIAVGMATLPQTQFISLKYVQMASDSKIIIWFMGHIQYRDVFQSKVLHHGDWCEALVPNDVDPANVRHNEWSVINVRTSAD